jgi:hypothetical protein
MAAQQQQSDFAASMGNTLDAAIKKHAKNDTNYGFVRLPPGINNGVAKLQKLYFAQFKSGANVGKWYLRGEGVVVFPEYFTVDGKQLKLAGAYTTSMQHPICDTKDQSNPPVVTPQEEHIDDVLNEFRKLGADTSGCTSAAHMLAIAAALQKVGPFFRFSTTSLPSRNPKEAPRTWENWNGVKGVEEWGKDAAAQVAGVKAAAPSTNGPAAPATVATNGPGISPTGPTGPGPINRVHLAAQAPVTPAPAPPPEQHPSLDQEDVETLLGMANSNNKGAQERLQQLALAAGVEQDDIDNAPDWNTVAEMAKGIPDGEAEGAGGGEAGNVWMPQPDEEYGFCPINPKSKVKGAKVAVKIVSVDSDKMTCTLLNLKNGKTTYKDVPWTDLESAVEVPTPA